MNAHVRYLKRAIDLMGAGVGLVLTAPLFPIIAAAIRLESPGPIFYSQIRAGSMPDAARGGRVQTFRMWKFRSMRNDAEKGKAVFAAKGDPRITKVGNFLRKTRLDELPQFWNVLVGDMSIVGPRPERPEMLENLAAAIPMFEERTRFVKPGITGLAQVSLDYMGRMDDSLPIAKYRDQLLNPFKLEGAENAIADDMRTKLLFDMAYAASLENVTTFLKTDLGILLKTPLVMLGARGR
jgi:lipopolysaccharide/colanic/teichoic acid biosynthesis glycosyltransferase